MVNYLKINYVFLDMLHLKYSWELQI